MKEKFKKIWEWLKVNVLTKEMIVPFILAEIIFWSPCIITGILAIVISNWYWTIFTSVIVFWSGPFTPALPLQVGLALLIKKLIGKIKQFKKKGNKSVVKTTNK